MDGILDQKEPERFFRKLFLKLPILALLGIIWLVIGTLFYSYPEGQANPNFWPFYLNIWTVGGFGLYLTCLLLTFRFVINKEDLSDLAVYTILYWFFLMPYSTGPVTTWVLIFFAPLSVVLFAFFRQASIDQSKRKKVKPKRG